jgi:hypothetical protein
MREEERKKPQACSKQFQAQTLTPSKTPKSNEKEEEREERGREVFI